MSEKFIDYLDLLSDGRAEMKQPDYIHENTGANRQERRHGRTRTGKHFVVPAEYREDPTNTPYRKNDENDQD